jgi:glycosyltransferase involved in cell wall biosynthesis
MSAKLPLRLAVYTDNSYRRIGAHVYADRALVRFIEALAGHVEDLVLAGQLDPDLPGAHYRVGEAIRFVGLPHYPSLVHFASAIVAMVRSLRRFWRALDDVDAVWLLGPHPLCLAFAALAVLRRRRVALGVRQDFPVYVRSRHPRRRAVHLAGDLLEGSYRLLARRWPTVVVGPQLAENYRRGRRVLEIQVSLIRDSDLADPAEAASREWDGEATVLSVGRLETEKNPLLLADVLRLLSGDGRHWRLVVCGEGPLDSDLRERLGSLGVGGRAEIRGYVPIDGGLMDLYRESDAFLHVSWTEGMPQVLIEAFAAGTPVVATAVGGVPDAVGDSALLVPPGDAEAAAAALRRLADEPDLRARLVRGGIERVRGRTLEAESRRVGEFLFRA